MERRRAELAQLSQVWTNALVAQQNVGQDRGPIHPFTPARLGGLGLGLGLGLTDISRSSFVVDDMALTSARQSMGTRSDLYLQELGVSPYNSRIRQVPSVVIGNINPSVSIGSPLKPMAALSTKQMGISKGSSPTSPSSPDQTGVENVNDLNLPASSRFNIEAICDSTHDMKLNGHDFTSASATGINTIDTMSSGIYGFKTPGAGNRNSSDLKSTSSGKNGPTNVPRSSDSGNDKTTATATATTGTLYDSDVDDPFGPPVERFHAPMLNRNMRRWSTSTIDSPMIAAMMEDSIADVRMAIQPLQTYRRASLASPPSAKIPMSSSKASPGATILPISPGNPSDAIQALSNDNRDGPQSIEFGLDGCRLEKE